MCDDSHLPTKMGQTDPLCCLKVSEEVERFMENIAAQRSGQMNIVAWLCLPLPMSERYCV